MTMLIHCPILWSKLILHESIYPSYAYCERSSHITCLQYFPASNLLTQEEVSGRTSNCTASYVLTNSHNIRGGAA